MIDLSNVDVEDLLRKIDVSNAKVTARGDEINFSCFGSEHSHGDESPSAYINIESTAWFCHGCKRRGNAISLVEQAQDVSRSTAETMLREWYGIEFDEPVGGSMVAETEARFRPVAFAPPALRPSPSWLSATRVDWNGRLREPHELYMAHRGFGGDVLNDWQIGYDYLSDRVTIPVFDIDGELIGFKGRDHTGAREPKYLILGDRPGMSAYGFEPYEASEVIFGLNRARDCRDGVLFEGELNAIAAAQAGVERPIATGMSHFSRRHAELIVRELDELVVFYDVGDAGAIGAANIVAALEHIMPVRVVEPLPEDPADLIARGQGDTILDLIERAPSSLASRLVFR
jgi:DNA primase